jgi:hypothetical protein
MCIVLNPDIKSWSSSSAFELKVNSLSHETLLFHNQMWFGGGGGPITIQNKRRKKKNVCLMWIDHPLQPLLAFLLFTVCCAKFVLFCF